MKKTNKLALMLLVFSLPVLASPDNPVIGEKAPDFTLKNIDGDQVSLSTNKDAKGYIVVFTSNVCPYALAWEDRIIELHKKYEKKGYPVIAINSNDPQLSPGDSYESMKKRAEEKHYPYPYLKDDAQEVFKKYGATRTPHVFVLQRTPNSDFIVKYIGTVDDNYKDASKVEEPYLSDALDAIIAGKEPDPATTKAIGCSIKSK